MSMIAEPNINSPANVDAAKMWRDDHSKFADVAQEHVRLSIDMPEKDYFPVPDPWKEEETSPFCVLCKRTAESNQSVKIKS